MAGFFARKFLGEVAFPSVGSDLELFVNAALILKRREVVLVVPKLVFIRGGRQAQRFSHFFRKKLVGARIFAADRRRRGKKIARRRLPLAAGGFEPIQFN